MPTFYTEAEMGESYRDTITDFEGVCIAIDFNITGCTRAVIEAKADKKAGKMGDMVSFDTTRLINIKTGKKIDQPTEATVDSPEIKKMAGGPVTRTATER